MKFKTKRMVVNRGGKKYIAVKWEIEVANENIKYFDWFEKVEVKKVTPKQPKNEDIK